jgi:hypothetical protein
VMRLALLHAAGVTREVRGNPRARTGAAPATLSL